MHVTAKTWVTPNMIRVTCAAAWMKELASGIEGAHFKLFIPRLNQTDDAFVAQLQDSPRPDVRTYTIRHMRSQQHEMDIDFVDHGDAGPASAWARRCKVGDIAGFAGPGPVKLQEFYADFYVVAADMSALPVAAATLEAMPRDAIGVACLEITAEADRQTLDAPEGVDVHWLINPAPHKPSTLSIDHIANLQAFTGTVQTCVAGESSMIKALRTEIITQRNVPKADTYISGYWKIGLIEDQHQDMKRAEKG